MSHSRIFANADLAARKLVEIANTVGPVQDGRIFALKLLQTAPQSIPSFAGAFFRRPPVKGGLNAVSRI
jgi:hypothetical protein